MAHLIEAITKDLGGFSVSRLLPQTNQPMVGPFIFLDHMGPAQFKPGQGINVRPHPHIGLATLSYLFEGSMLHRDSLGNCVEVFPGDVNWMTAGRGIVHSERETLEVRAKQHSMDGLQSWLALPKAQAELDPAFIHIKKEALPHRMMPGVLMRLVAGEAYGMKSPVTTYSPMLYLDIIIDEGCVLPHPNPEFETAVYVQWGEIDIHGLSVEPQDFAIVDSKTDTTLIAKKSTRLIWIGGAPFTEKPLIEWNFVAYSKERLQQAKQDWREGHFPRIPQDHEEQISY
jgi:redox-sensitive bicupin YhaK (pirin superfamily)